MPSHAALALCSPDGFLPGYCEAQVDAEWCVYQGSTWAQALVMGLSNFNPCTCIVPYDDNGKPIYWTWPLAGYTIYLWSLERNNGVPVIALDSGGNGIEVNVQHGIVLMTLNPDQTAAIPAGKYTVFYHARRSGDAMSKPLFSANLVVHKPSSYADAAIVPSPLLGTVPVINSFLVNQAMTCQLLTVLAQPPALTFVTGGGNGPPTPTVGVPGQYYVDNLTGAIYGPNDPVTGWPATPIYTPATPGVAQPNSIVFSRQTLPLLATGRLGPLASPVSDENQIFAYSKALGAWLTPDDDFDYDAGTQEIVVKAPLLNAMVVGSEVVVRYLA